jgi:hypothetical protein
MSIVNQAIVSKILKSAEAERKVSAQAETKTDMLIQQHIDALRLSCKTSYVEFMKGNSKTNPARAEVKALFEAFAEALGKGESAARNYATSYWMAFEQNVPFQRSLFTNKPKAEAKPSDKKAGKVKETSRTELDKTLSKAIEQARLLKLDNFAAEILDLCLESLHDFKEIE